MARAEGRLRAGVVGAGHMGQYHMLVYAELWDMELVGVVDVDRDRAARVAAHYDTRAFADHRALIGRVDLVSVAVPTEHHFQVASDFLEAGVSVLVEKPITPTLEEARELFAVARRTRAVLHVGHVERFNGAVQELKKIVERPLLVESRRLGPFEPRVQKDTVVMDLMIHDLDIVLGLIDSPPRRLTAMGSTVHSGSVDVANVRSGSNRGRSRSSRRAAPPRRRSARSRSRSPTRTSSSTTPNRTSVSTGAPRRSTRSTGSRSATAAPPSSSTSRCTRTTR